MKTILITLLLVVVAGFGVYWFINRVPSDVTIDELDVVATGGDEDKKDEPNMPAMEKDKEKSVIGQSVEGRDITAYHYGTGDTEVLLAGGIHGGYSWNTALVAYEAMDWLKSNPDVIPANVKVTVIPVFNPDGLNKVVDASMTNFTKADVSASVEDQTAGRFNAHKVDLNRNFDCNWKTEGKWQSKTVSGGSKVFSELESQAMKKYVEENNPVSVVVWYSAADGVFASSCSDGILAETATLLDIFSKASGYTAYDSFDFYETSGDMVNWLAKKKIPAISVLLKNHTDTDWVKNKAGIEAVLAHYADQT